MSRFMKLKKLVVCLVMSVAMFVTCIPIYVDAAGDVEEKIVRVGYYESEAMEQGASDDDVKYGYAYEYYRKLSEYTGWKYEYVYADFSVLYDMLVNGDIDLLAGMAKKDERIGVVGYPDLPMGNETVSLAKHADDDTLTADHATLNGKKIGVIYSDLQNRIQKFIDTEKIDATVVGFVDYETMYAAFDANEIAAYVVEGDSSSYHENSEILYAFDQDDYYLCTNIKRPDILEELNAAQNEININEPGYISILKAKYFSSNMSVSGMPDEAQEWLDSHSELRVGYLNNYLPYSDTGKDGNATGLVKDEIDGMIEAMGLGMTVTYTGYDSYNAMTDAIAADEIDCAFPVAGGFYYAEKNGMNQSGTVLSSTSEIVYKNKLDEEKLKSIAINDNNNIQYYYVKQYYPDAEIVVCKSIDDCLGAVKNGKAGFTVVNGMRVNDILKSHKYSGLSVIQAGITDETTFGVKIGNEDLLALLNQGIKLLGNDFAYDHSYQYVNQLHRYDVWDTILHYVGLVFVIIIVAAAVVVLYFYRRAKRAERSSQQ